MQTVKDNISHLKFLTLEAHKSANETFYTTIEFVDAGWEFDGGGDIRLATSIPPDHDPCDSPDARVNELIEIYPEVMNLPWFMYNDSEKELNKLDILNDCLSYELYFSPKNYHNDIRNYYRDITKDL